MFRIIKYSILFSFCLFAVAFAKEKHIQVKTGGSLELKLSYGSVTINSWNKNEVYLKYDEFSEDEYEEDDGNEQDISVEESGNTIIVSSGNGYNGSDIEITVPVDFNIDAKTNAGNLFIKGNIKGKVSGWTGGGDVEVAPISGNVNLSSAGGNMKTANISGNAKLYSAGGNIRTGAIDGDLILNTGGGNVKIGNVGKNLKLNTGGGNIVAGNVGGSSVLNTGGGNISLGISGGNTKISSGGGDITISQSKGEVSARTGSGRIKISNVSNRIDVYTGAGDGEITLSTNYKGNSSIKSSNGNVTLYVPANLSVTVNAEVSSWGWYGDEENDESIISDFKANVVNKNDDDIKNIYKINGGGGIINLEVGSGAIYIKKIK